LVEQARRDLHRDTGEALRRAGRPSPPALAAGIAVGLVVELGVTGLVSLLRRSCDAPVEPSALELQVKVPPSNCENPSVVTGGRPQKPGHALRGFALGWP
jgi:hypothetical protein